MIDSAWSFIRAIYCVGLALYPVSNSMAFMFQTDPVGITHMFAQNYVMLKGSILPT